MRRVTFSGSLAVAEDSRDAAGRPSEPPGLTDDPLRAPPVVRPVAVGRGPGVRSGDGDPGPFGGATRVPTVGAQDLALWFG